jgi:uncharacterized protein DUF541
MHGRKVAIVGAISGLLVVASGTVGFGLGRDAGAAATVPPAADGQGEGATAGMVASSAPATGIAVGQTASKGILPYPGPDFPGLPPFPGQTPTGDGLHAVGVAYKQTEDAKAKPGQDLVRQAFEDAVEQAKELAQASGVKLGTLIAVSDLEQTQPYYRACVEPLAGGGAESKPAAPDSPTILPAPVPGSPPDCSPTYYVVAWVFVRYGIA